MAQHLIRLFMWGYQPHYRISLEILTKSIFKELGIDAEPKVLLVGARKPQSKNPNLVCVEPEDGEWPGALFDGLLESIEAIEKNHDLQNVVYGDQPSMDDKPEVIRRDSVTQGVQKALSTYDVANNVRSFCGNAVVIEDYYVVPVIQIPELVFEQFPPLHTTTQHAGRTFQRERSLLHAAMGTLLEEATKDLQRPEPGRSVSAHMRRADEIVRIAARDFMFNVAYAIGKGYGHVDLFERFNAISSLMYEGAQGIGHIVLVDPNDVRIDYVLRFRVPVPFREHRWARKVLEMASPNVELIADSECIYGLGRLRHEPDVTGHQAFTIDFLDHYHWELRSGSQVLLRSLYGVPRLPQEAISKELFAQSYKRMFPECSTEEGEHTWKLCVEATRQGHGCMLVVAADAAAEAQRLAQQGTVIEPTELSEELLRCVSGIDGTIILDPHGICHAIGVILDGPATSACTPSRGSRFNSGLRYVSAGHAHRMAIIVSDDHTVDIIPVFRPQISRVLIENNLTALESATIENYHKPRSWIDSHRFYFSDAQCTRANAALDRLDELPLDVGQIRIHTGRLEAHPDMNESYLVE